MTSALQASTPAPVDAAGECTLVCPPPERRLPTVEDFRRVQQLPIAQLFVVGRSGSSLVHAFLDGHPEVLHIPHTFKFYDFIATYPGILSRPAAEIARCFVESPLVAHLMDSHESVIIGGRLGPEMQTYIRIDAERFCAAFVNVTGGAALTERSLFVALVLTYGWCVGQDLARVNVVLQHLHHGDWLFPERLLERSNYHPPLPEDRVQPLRADKYVLSVRAPYDAFLAYVKFTGSHGLPPAERLDLQEKFIRFLEQDWDRLAIIEASNVPHFVAHLEDFRWDAKAVMKDLARFLGINPDLPCLHHLTYYGFAWHGDIYTEPSTTVLKARPSRPIRWQERWILDALVGPDARRHGYRTGIVGPVKWKLLPWTVRFPAADLYDPSISSPDERRRGAEERASARVTFARQLAAQWPQ